MSGNSGTNFVSRTLERMYKRCNAGIKLDLDAVRRLLHRLNDPQEVFAAIHVAGSNGKGSVCAMIESVLRERGLRPGLYTSPHLLRFNERIKVNGVPVDDDALAPLIEKVEKADRVEAALPGGRMATFFEFTTALAFLCFRQHNVRLAVIETGMGGRLDATNVLTPAVAVITRIGLDHTQWLGSTLSAVAGEKAGIIKPRRPLVCGAMPSEAGAVVARIAAEKQAPLIFAEESVAVKTLRSRKSYGCRVSLTGSLMDYGVVSLAAHGGYFLENLATAVAALETFSRIAGIGLDAQTMAKGLGAVVWPARLQRIHDNPPVLLDGAHNTDGAKALMRSLTGPWKNKPLALVAGICADKNYHGMLKIFQHRARRCWTVPFSSSRALDHKKLAQAARECGNWEVTATTLQTALEEAMTWARERDGLVLIAGSLFLAADVLRLTDKTAWNPAN